MNKDKLDLLKKSTCPHCGGLVKLIKRRIDKSLIKPNRKYYFSRLWICLQDTSKMWFDEESKITLEMFEKRACSKETQTVLTTKSRWSSLSGKRILSRSLPFKSFLSTATGRIQFVQMTEREVETIQREIDSSGR